MRNLRVAAAIAAALLATAAPAASAHEGNPDFRSVVDAGRPGHTRARGRGRRTSTTACRHDQPLRRGRGRRGLRGRALRARPGRRLGRAQPELARLLPERRPLRRVGGARQRRPRGRARLGARRPLVDARVARPPDALDVDRAAASGQGRVEGDEDLRLRDPDRGRRASRARSRARSRGSARTSPRSRSCRSWSGVLGVGAGLALLAFRRRRWAPRTPTARTTRPGESAGAHRRSRRHRRGARRAGARVGARDARSAPRPSAAPTCARRRRRSSFSSPSRSRRASARVRVFSSEGESLGGPGELPARRRQLAARRAPAVRSRGRHLHRDLPRDLRGLPPGLGRLRLQRRRRGRGAVRERLGPPRRHGGRHGDPGVGDGREVPHLRRDRAGRRRLRVRASRVPTRVTAARPPAEMLGRTQPKLSTGGRARWSSSRLVPASPAGALGIVTQGAIAGGTSVWAALDTSVIGDVLETRFGTVWGIRELAWVVHRPRGDQRTASGRVVARSLLVPTLAFLVVAPSLSGHASTYSPEWLLVSANTGHVAAMSIWVGGVAALAFAVRAATAALEPADRTRLLSATLLRFSPIALASVFVARQPPARCRPSPTSIRSPTFGRPGSGEPVARRSSLLGVLVAIGLVHRRRSLPQLRAAADDGSSPGQGGKVAIRALRAEIALFVARTRRDRNPRGEPPPGVGR